MKDNGDQCMRCEEIFLSGRRDRERERERVVGKGVGMQPETFPTSEKATTFCVFSHEIFPSVHCPLPAALIDLPLSALSLSLLSLSRLCKKSLFPVNDQDITC